MAAQDKQSNFSQATTRRLELSTEQVQSGIEFSKVSCGRGTAVVIQSVQPGPLSEAGLVVGQRLVGISDPIQADQVWPLRENASLRYVRDAIRMRRADTVTLLVSSGSQIHEESADRAFTKTKSIINGTGQENLLSPSPSSTARFQAFSKEQGGRQQIDRQGAAGSEGDIGSDSEQGFLDVLVASFDEGDAVQRGPGNSSMDDAPTLRTRVEELSADQEREINAYRRRVKKRKEYLNEVSQRNDSKFFLWLAVAFLGPAFIGLVVAYTSGYLDLLQTMY